MLEDSFYEQPLQDWETFKAQTEREGMANSLVHAIKPEKKFNLTDTRIEIIPSLLPPKVALEDVLMLRLYFKWFLRIKYKHVISYIYIVYIYTCYLYHIYIVWYAYMIHKRPWLDFFSRWKSSENPSLTTMIEKLQYLKLFNNNRLTDSSSKFERLSGYRKTLLCVIVKSSRTRFFLFTILLNLS